MDRRIERSVIDLVLEAGRRLKADFYAQIEIVEKSPKDFVTDVDLRLDNFLKTRLSEIAPGSMIYSEENNQTKLDDAQWVIDPLDGTANFILGIPHFGISLTYMENLEPKNAWVLNPMTEELFHLGSEGEALLNNSRIAVSHRKTIEDSYGIFGFSANFKNISRYHDEWGHLFARSKKAIGALSPSLSICAVARGKSDYFIDFGCSVEGKIGAALLLKRAGGMIRNYDDTDYDVARIGMIGTNGMDVRQGIRR